MSRAGVRSAAETSGVFGPNGLRPDIWVPQWPANEHKSHALDVVIPDPTATSNVRAGAHKTQLAAAKAAERRKRTKYGPLADSLGLVFVPLVFESFGAWGPSAVDSLRATAAAAEENLGVDAATFLSYHIRQTCFVHGPVPA